MWFALFFTSLLNPAPPAAPVDSLPRNAFSPVLGLQAQIVDHRPFRPAPAVVLGCAYTQAVSDRWAVQIGLQTRVAPGYDLYTRWSDTLVQPAAFSQVSAEFQVRSVVFLDMPVTLHRRFGTAGRQAWLLGVKPTVNFPANDQGVNRWQASGASGPGIQSDVNPAFEALTIRDGFHRFDLGLVAGWNYRIAHGLILDVRYQQGLVDLTADNFFKSSELTLDSGVQITLRYGL